jgi:hypothetical protein
MAKRLSKLNRRAIAQQKSIKRRQQIQAKVFQDFDQEDVIESNTKIAVTDGLWTAGTTGSLKAEAFYTASMGSNAKYYKQSYSDSALTQPEFAIAYANYFGSSSLSQSGASSGMTPTKAIYTQYANLLLDSTDDIFTIDGTNDHEFFAITIDRRNYKEQMNAGNWMLTLSSGSHEISLCDDSTTSTSTTAGGKKVYNIVSGSDSEVFNSTHIYGLFYPEAATMILSKRLLCSATNAYTANAFPSFTKYQYTSSANADAGHAGYLWDTIKSGSVFTARSQEDITSAHYFCRIKNGDYNFSTNPTFTFTGSGQLRHSTMVRDPQVYVTTVGMYNDENELVATAKLSKPLLKNFTREALIKVKLEF